MMLLQPKSMSSSSDCSSLFAQETNLFFGLGVDDVLVQPSLDYDMDVTLDMCLCRLDHRSNFLRLAAAREADLFWKAVHRILPNLPRLSSTLGEPAVGSKFGNNHEIIKEVNFG